MYTSQRPPVIWLCIAISLLLVSFILIAENLLLSVLFCFIFSHAMEACGHTTETLYNFLGDLVSLLSGKVGMWNAPDHSILDVFFCLQLTFYCQILYKLLDLGCNPEVKSNDGDTALQIMIKRQRLPCVMALLSRSVDASSVGSEGNNALHLAISVSSRWSINWYLGISVVFVLN